MAEFKSLPKPKVKTISDGSLEGLLLVLCSIWILGSSLIIMICAVGIGPDWYRYWQLQSKGEVTSGRLIRRDAGDEWASHIYEFTVTALDGLPQQVTGHQSVKVSIAPPLRTGQEIAVRYLPENPTLSAIELYFSAPSKTPLIFGGSGVLLVLLGLAVMPQRWQAWTRVRHLWARGQVARATVVNRWRTADQQQHVIYCVAYEFEAILPDGSRRIILAAESNELAYQSLRLNQTTLVRYLSHSPEVCCLDLQPLIEQSLEEKLPPAQFEARSEPPD